MILAQTPAQALILMLIGMVCWGLWAGMYRMTRKWRYELFYFDVAFGLLVGALIYAFTLGSLGFDGFSFQDDLMHSRRQFWLMAFASGAVFNLANMIMMGGIVVAGLSVAYPLGLGLGLMIGVGMKLVVNATGNPLLLFTGTACLLVATVMMAVAYSFHVSALVDRLVKEGKIKTTGSAPGSARGMIVSADAPSSTKGLLLGIVSGALMWLMFPLQTKAGTGDWSMGPYSMTVMFAFGVFATTLVYNLFFINLPVQGEPLELPAYLRGSLRSHLAGMGAGFVLCTGVLAYLVAKGGPPEARLAPLTSYTVQQGAVLLAAIVGIFAWKDFRDAQPRVRAMVWAFLLLFAAGLAALGSAAKWMQG